MSCSSCQSTEKQYRSGFNRSGSQRYRCGICNRAYTPVPKENGYPIETRMLALRMYLKATAPTPSGAYCKSVRKVWIIGLLLMQRTYLKPLAPRRLTLLNSMSSTPSSGTKKRDLPPDDCRSRDTLYPELGCCRNQKQREHAGLSGSGFRCKTILQ